MGVPKSRLFRLIFSFQILIILIDLMINTGVGFITQDKLLFTFVFIIQDVSIILSFSSIIFNIYSSRTYQIGLAHILYEEFRPTLITITLYFLLCLSQHVWFIFRFNDFIHNSQWPILLIVLYCLQRFFSCIYYYLFKRAALKIYDFGERRPNQNISNEKY